MLRVHRVLYVGLERYTDCLCLDYRKAFNLHYLLFHEAWGLTYRRLHSSFYFLFGSKIKVPLVANGHEVDFPDTTPALSVVYVRLSQKYIKKQPVILRRLREV